MKISTKGRYGLKVMIDLAVYSKGENVTLKSIAKRQGISETYLEQLVPYLKKANLIKSIRGSQGGYLLAHEAQNITVGQILRALEGSLSPVSCLDDTIVCDDKNFCISRIVWEKIQESINNAIDTLTLKDLISEFKDNNKIGSCNL